MKKLLLLYLILHDSIIYSQWNNKVPNHSLEEITSNWPGPSSSGNNVPSDAGVLPSVQYNYDGFL